MNLIVALGNPGEKYRRTRHNIGFLALDSFAKMQGFALQPHKRFSAELFKSGESILLKPQTFMNLSGNAVRAAFDYYKPSKMLVIHDDLDLGFGAIRLKFGGGNGGHNGLRSIDGALGAGYFRLRLGIGRPLDASKNIADFVLENFNEGESAALGAMFEATNAAISDFIAGEPLEALQNRHTKKAIFEGAK